MNTSSSTGSSHQDRPVVVCVNDREREDFLAAHLNGQWPYDIILQDSAKGLDALLDRLRETNARVLMSAWSTPRLPETLLQDVPNLKYDAHICGAVRSLIPRNLIEQGLLVTNWGNSISRTVAEHCLMQILASLRHMTHYHIMMHDKGGWKTGEDVWYSLFERKVGLHGFGAISRELVALLEPFHCDIWAFSPSVPDSLFRQLQVSRCDSLEDLFAESDVLVELAPLTPKNCGLVDENLLRKLRPGSVFINSGRGAVVDEEALGRIAKEGKIQIALDVYAQEPLPVDSPLRGLPNVLLTPHIAGPTIDRRKDAGLLALQNVEAYFKDLEVEPVVDLATYDRIT